MPFAELILVTAFSAIGAPTSATPASAAVDAIYPEIEKLYLDLHQSPELSDHEEKTAAKLAARLKTLGFEVTTGIGGNGVVGILKNGEGPVVMVRTDLDGLPVEEKTGLPYASKVTTKGEGGAAVPVMHACGHDTHMSVWIGTATILSREKDRWHGTLMMVGQPAEEIGSGARRMLKDGLFTKFPKPTFAVALHGSAELPAGKASVVPNYALANVDSVDIVVHGRGGHGAAPHMTIDPIVIGARIVVALQTIVARENNPVDPAVVTVGSFHGGFKHNVIPDTVHLQLTVRSYKDEVRKKLLAAIERISKGEAAAAGAPTPPEVTVSEGTPATYNDPALSKRIEQTLAQTLGAANVVPQNPVMGGEDFSEYGRAGVPSVIFWLGSVDPKKFDAAKSSNTPLPSLHSPLFAPDRAPTLKTGIRGMSAVVLDLFAKR